MGNPELLAVLIKTWMSAQFRQWLVCLWLLNHLNFIYYFSIASFYLFVCWVLAGYLS